MSAVQGRDGASGEILIVADAGPDSGLGHIARCSAVAVALRARGLAVRVVAVGTTEPPHSTLAWECAAAEADIPANHGGVVLVDSYHLDPEAVAGRAGARRLAVMHDLGPLSARAELTVTTDPRLAGTRAGVVGGPRFTCLGPLYWGLPQPPEAAGRVRRVLVATGGGDPGGHAVPLARAVWAALEDAEVALVRGPQAGFAPPAGVRLLDRPPSLLEPLQWAELVVTACGSSLLETLAVGTPAIGLLMADNQRPIADELARQGATELFTPEDLAGVSGALRRLADDPARRLERSRAGQRVIDGYGALRVAYLLAGLLRSG